MLSPFLFSAAGGLAVYWSPPAAEEGGQPSAPIDHDRREERFLRRLQVNQVKVNHAKILMIKNLNITLT